MKLISHRGNITGRQPDQENTPAYIESALATYDCEIDVFYKYLDYKTGSKLSAKLKPMRYIVDTGRTDAQVAA